MNTRPARVPNVENSEHRTARLLRESAIAEQQLFFEDFDRQAAAIIKRMAKPE